MPHPTAKPACPHPGDTTPGSTLQLVEGIQHPDRLSFERKTIRRVDLHLLPILGLLYAVALIDRVNLGVASIAGMGKDLELNVGSRYSIVSCVYFIPYIILELPSNLVLRHLGTRHFLTFLVVAWGITQLSMAFVTDWYQLAVLRVLLGTFEAGFLPALIFLISTWYTRHEVQTRLATFYVVSIFLGGFSAIFAYGLSLLEGKAGLAGWSWIFLIEGAITVFFGFIAWSHLPDFPDNNTFLTTEQTAFMIERIERDRGDSMPDPITRNKVLDHLCDWRVWVYGLMLMCATAPSYAVGFFIPIILKSMGWNTSQSLLLSAPPYVVATLSILFFSWISDVRKQRAPFIAVQTLMSILGLCMTGFLSRGGWRYTGLFLTTAGSGGCVPAVFAYASNNIIGHSKRAVTTAIVVSFGGIGGVLATTVFRQQDSPRYAPGMFVLLFTQLLLLTLLSATSVHFWMENKKERKGGRESFLYTL